MRCSGLSCSQGTDEGCAIAGQPFCSWERSSFKFKCECGGSDGRGDLVAATWSRRPNDLPRTWPWPVRLLLLRPLPSCALGNTLESQLPWLVWIL